MVSNWEEFTVEETCYVTDGAHSRVDRQTEGILYLTSKNIGVGSLILEKVDYISHEDYEKLFSNTARAQRRPTDGDILIGIIGTFGNAYRYKKSDLFGISSAIAILRPNPEILNSNFLYYVVTSKAFKAKHAAYKSGSVQAYTNIPTIKFLSLPVPPISHQKAIAHVLGLLDERIELIRRTNETLECVGQALFKSWFVDFDPLIDNALASGKEIPAELCERAAARTALGDKRQPLPSEIRTLFPDQFTYKHELGWIPEGWEAGSFGDVVQRRNEKIGDREAVVLSAVASGELVRSDEHFKKQVYSKNIGKYLAVEYWDIAYNPSRINIGSVGMLKEPILGAVSPVYVVARPNYSYRWFIEFLMHREHVCKWVNSLASGSVRQSLSFDDFSSIPCIIPPVHLTKIFDQKWTAFHGGINAGLKKAKTLTSLRDTLLPKLLSGEIRIPEAEKMVEELAL